MSTYAEKPDPILKWMFWPLVIPALIMLFIALSQPAWNGKKLIAQQTADCKKRGGVQIIDHGLFGDTYSCESRLDK